MSLSPDNRGFWPENGLLNIPADADTAKQIVSDYRATFLKNETSKRVLTHILSHLCFYRDIKTEEERVLHNAAKELLSFLGMWGSSVGMEEEFVNKLSKFDMSIYIEGDDENERSE